MKRTVALALSVILILAAILSACAPAAPQATNAPAAPESSAATDAPAATEAPAAEPPAQTEAAPVSEESTGAKVVRVLAVAGPETDALIENAREFEAQTGITASIEQVARPLWGERKVRELLEDSGLYDVVMIGGGDDLLWVKTKGHVLPLDSYISQEDRDQIEHIDYFIKDGQLIGAPQYYNFPMLFYRKDLLEDPAEQAAFKEKYGRDLTVPKTYDELMEVAEFFHRPPEMYGYFLGGVDWSVFLDHTYFSYGMGANYGDQETGELTLNTPEQARAMEVLTKMAQFNPPGWETASFFDGDLLFQEGKVFMYQNWFYIWNTLRETMPDQAGMAPPTGDVQPGAHLGAFVAVIPQSAPSPDAAGEFISWMLSPEYQVAQTVATGNMPVRTDVLQDPAVREALVGIEMYEQALPYLTYQQTTWPNEISSGVAEAIWKVFDGEMSAQEAVDWLQNEKFKDRQAIE